MLLLTVMAGLMLATSEPQANELVGDKKEVGKSAEPKIFAKTPTGVIYQSVAVRSSKELSLLTPSNAPAGADAAALAKVLKVDAIDWKKQMVIVVYGGEKPTGGYSVEVKSLEIKDKKLVVRWKLKSPGADDIVAQVITYPSLTILVDRFDGEVVFDPAGAKK
jgi:hypothetical protein